MFGWGKKKDVPLAAPIPGTVVSIGAVNDPTFASKMLGDGFGVVPATDRVTVCASARGRVASIFPTGHACGLITESGLEILVHIGIDTVEMKGDGFEPRCTKGSIVDTGDPIVDVDAALIRARGFDPVVLTVVTSKQRVNAIAVAEGPAVQGDTVAYVTLA